MSPEQNTQSVFDSAQQRHLVRLIGWTKAVVYWERLWPRLWPLMILLSLFIIAIQFNILPALPASLHLLLLGCTLIGTTGFLVKAFHELEWPSEQHALIRLERENKLSHQPLQALRDEPVKSNTNHFSEAVWLLHQDRMAKVLAQTKRPWPRSTIYRKDPYSLRAVLILLLVLGSIESRHDFKDRFLNAFQPSVQNETISTGWRAQIWITPPAHTQLTTQYIDQKNNGTHEQHPLIFPQHSRLQVRLEGQSGGDKVLFSIGPFEDPMENLGKGAYSLETEVDQGDVLRIKQGKHILFQWPIALNADIPPEIHVKGPPTRSFRGQLHLPFEATDDYGLKEVRLSLRRVENTEQSAEEILITHDVEGKKLKSHFNGDLAAHPWAGQKVIATPIAIDNFDQTSVAPSLEFNLPERYFNHPLARELVELRRSLFEDSIEIHRHVSQWLYNQLLRPADFNHDLNVYLALKVGADRLRGEVTAFELASIQAILWETAVHLDEGPSGTARNQLEYMSRQMNALLQKAEDKAAMEALFEQMHQSLSKFMHQMAQNTDALQGFEELIDNPQVNMLSHEQLIDMLNKARELMRQGNSEAAQKIMEQFQSILQRLATQPKPDPVQAAKAREILTSLRQIRNDQQTLLDRTFQRTRNQDRPSLNATRNAIAEAEEQKKLRELLHQQLQRLKDMQIKPSRDLRAAEQNMKQAIRSLESGLDENAVQSQTQALRHLEEGLKNSAQSLAQKIGMQALPQSLPGFDPLGRGRGRAYQNESGEVVPTEREIERSHEILQELYRRAGQKSRPEQELQYIERLLDRF